MKNSKIKILLICISVSVLLFNCKSDDDNKTTLIDADTYTSLNDLVESLKPSQQSFTFDPTVNQTITGEGGTIITINSNAFTDGNGNTITKPITAKLREHLTLETMILSNVQTASNNNMLVTGGSFNLTFEDENGTTPNISQFKIQAQMPVKTDITGYENEMIYYEGSSNTIDGREAVNWEPVNNSDSWLDKDIFNIANLVQGLSNCDALYDMAKEDPTQFEVKISDVTDYTRGTVWMVVKDFPSVIVITSLNNDKDALKTYKESIPKGLNATLIAMVVDEDNYLKFGSLPITVSGDDTFNVKVDYGTTEGLRTLIKNIAN